MNEDLVAYLDVIDPSLLTYLDRDHDLSLETVERLYGYALALRQGLVTPAQIREDWDDFFDLADAFVLAYGSRRLDGLHKGSPLLVPALEGEAPSVLADTDRTLLVALVRELGDFVAARRSSNEGRQR
jgi:hypothetical protein